MKYFYEKRNKITIDILKQAINLAIDKQGAFSISCDCLKTMGLYTVSTININGHLEDDPLKALSAGTKEAFKVLQSDVSVEYDDIAITDLSKADATYIAAKIIQGVSDEDLTDDIALELYKCSNQNLTPKEFKENLMNNKNTVAYQFINALKDFNHMLDFFINTNVDNEQIEGNSPHPLQAENDQLKKDKKEQENVIEKLKQNKDKPLLGLQVFKAILFNQSRLANDVDTKKSQKNNATDNQHEITSTKMTNQCTVIKNLPANSSKQTKPFDHTNPFDDCNPFTYNSDVNDITKSETPKANHVIEANKSLNDSEDLLLRISH